MPGPAARMGDMTAHGGTIAVGFPTVLIAGQPAARLTDMHVCPMVTPAPVPVPHVGGPVIGPGCPTVLIGNMPAVTIGDMAVCVGPPDVIAMGAPTVIIGMAGAGSASGGGAGGAGAGGAHASAAAAQFDNKESVTKEEHWVEFKFVDKAGLPVSGVPYVLTDPSGKVSEGVLRLDGRVLRSGLIEGSAEVVLRSVFEARWSKSMARPGDSVTLSAKVLGLSRPTPARFRIYRRDLHGPDMMVGEVDAGTQGEKVEASWTFPADAADPEDVLVPPEGSSGVSPRSPGYSSFSFYFDVIVDGLAARSGILYLEDTLELEVTDEDGKPLANETYRIIMPDGAVKEGQLDGGGRAKLDGVPMGPYQVQFPALRERKVF